MMQYISERAEHYYIEAEKHFHQQDAKSLRSSEAMRKIYHGILKKMQADNFQVFHQRYTLSKPKKVWLLLSSLAGL
jgi:phytoene synthase